MNRLPFRALLYRYFFYAWLFQDVQKGNLWERSVAMKHNKTQAHWLPTYMRRWTVCGAGLFLLAWGVEVGLQSPVLSAFFYVPSVLTVPYNAVTAVGWFFLQRWKN